MNRTAAVVRLRRSPKSELAPFLADELARLGYRSSKPDALAAVAKESADGQEERAALAEAVVDYQETWKPDLDEDAEAQYGRKLVVDGTPGPVTVGHILNRTCSVPDRLFATDGTLIPMMARWPNSCVASIPIYLDEAAYRQYRMGLSFEEFRDCYQWAIDHIRSHAQIGLHIVQSRKDARVYVGFEPLGRGVLGWSHLANDDCGPKEQRYTAMGWDEVTGKLTPLHEGGHLVGMPHRSGAYVMNPSLRTDIREFTAQDVRDLLGLGYQKAQPKPPTDPTDPTDPSAWEPWGITQQRDDLLVMRRKRKS